MHPAFNNVQQCSTMFKQMGTRSARHRTTRFFPLRLGFIWVWPSDFNVCLSVQVLPLRLGPLLLPYQDRATSSKSTTTVSHRPTLARCPPSPRGGLMPMRNGLRHLWRHLLLDPHVSVNVLLRTANLFLILYIRKCKT